MTFDSCLETLPRPVAVVGNGALPRGAARVIDAFPSVVRFNAWQVTPDSGERCDLWVVNGCDDVPRDHCRRRTATPYHATDDGGRVVRWAGDLKIHLPAQRWSELVREIKPRKPSTGLMTLFACSMLGVPVVAFGFDGFASGHYWQADHQHDHDDESAALALLPGIAFVR